MISKQFRVAAAAVALAYIAVQAFQTYVFRTVGEPATPAEGLVFGAHPLHIVRSTAMLAAMFALIFFYGAICLQRARDRPVLAGFTFLSFVLFGYLEIGLRSVELFWTQLELAPAYLHNPDPTILGRVRVFESVQHALYVPLGLSVLIGSALGAWLFASGRKIDRVIQIVFVLNVARNATRMLTVYFGWQLFPDAAYSAAYFPMVIAFYAPAAYWLVRRDALRP